MMDRFALGDASSLLEWFPKIKYRIPTPGTKILKLNRAEISELLGMLDGVPLNQKLKDKIFKISNTMKEPFFLRTDQASGKHEWKDTCYVTDKKKVLRHIASLMEFHMCADIMGIPFKALVFREYLPLQSKFTAFNEMPVAPEWRYFVRDGKVECSHFYWVDDAIRNPSIKDWQPVLHQMHEISGLEKTKLERYAWMFGNRNPGYWSVDFALTQHFDWVLIDAARGEVSWHPADCIYNPDREALLAEQNKPKPNFDMMLIEIDKGGDNE